MAEFPIVDRSPGVPVERAKSTSIHILMERGPSQDGDFIEVENDEGQSINVGTWHKHTLTYGEVWCLRIDKMPEVDFTANPQGHGLPQDDEPLDHKTDRNPTGSVSRCEDRSLHGPHEWQETFGAYFDVYCPGNDGKTP